MTSIAQFSDIRKAFALRYKGRSSEQLELVNALAKACEKYLSAGWGGVNGRKALCSTNSLIYKEFLSEVLVAHILESKGIKFEFPKSGPDFLLRRDGTKIWVELITPRPAGLPEEWMANDIFFKAIDYPNDKLLLRWTSAIKEKTEKLECYLKNGTISQQDIYVIAINGINLRGGHGFPKLEGISQYPFAVEAMFGLGAQQIHIDRKTLKSVGRSHVVRNSIQKSEKSTVPVGTFIDPEHTNRVASANISAIWALDIDEMCLVKECGPAALVHNPLAKNKIEKHFLPAYSEYVCEVRENDWQLTNVRGSFSS